MKRESIIDKVRAMLRLAENDGATPAERDLAAARAQEFMTKHRLQRAELAEEERGDVLHVRQDIKHSDYLDIRWRVVLALVIGRANHVLIWRATAESDRYGSRVYIVGIQEDIDFTLSMRDWLVPILEMECDSALILAREEDFFDELVTAQSRKEWRRSFLSAASREIGRRLLAQSQSQEQAAPSSGMELVRALDGEIRRYAATALGFRGHGKSKVLQSRGGAIAGSATGRAIDLAFNKKVGGQAKELGA